MELTGTRWASLMQFTFPQSDRANVPMNPLGHGGSIEVVGDHVVRGMSNGREAIDGAYFVAEFSRPFTDLGTFRKVPGEAKGWGIGDKQVVRGGRTMEGSYAGSYVTFRTGAGEKILVKMAHGTSYEQAAQRLRDELPGWNFARVRDQARAEWSRLLDRVQVTGGTEKQRMLFYSTLFQSFASPRLIAAKGEQFTDMTGKVRTATHDRYGPVPFWDTGRNQIVLLELMEPDVVRDIMQSEYEMAQEKGYMNTSFHGDNAVLLYLGAWKRGIPFDYAGVYDYLRRNAIDPKGPRDYLAEYDRNGWIADIVPAGNPSPPYAGGKAGAATTLEYAWDDHALADYARRLGKTEDADRLLKRAGNYARVFDKSTGFIRGRTADGQWIAPFDPQEPYYNFMMKEASGWSTLWLAPHDVKGLMALLDGRGAFNAKLDRFFSTPYASKGICRDCTGLIGQYVHGNQPDQQVPYYYDWSGQPWKTQALVRRILDEMYGSDAAGYGYAGMDDQGATSSWYVMSAMGFYPVDYAAAWPAIRRRAFDPAMPDIDSTLGRGFYHDLGYIPADKIWESVSRTQEYAYDDWAMAHLAEVAGASEDARRLKERSRNYRNVIDPKIGFARPRFADGRWWEAYDPIQIGHDPARHRDYTEANGWQATFLNQHDIYGLIDHFGGDAAFEKKLDAFFNAPSVLPANAPPDISGLVGQYAHGNEPDQHATYLYAYCGAPAKTQAMVRRLLTEMYKAAPDGVIGNDDCGQMSAWFVLSALGIYPVDPVSALYVLGSPLFDEARVDLGHGRSLRVRAAGNGPDSPYVQSVRWNGRMHDRNWIGHAELVQGGELLFVMGARPSRFGVEPRQRPPSFGVQPT